MEKLNHGLGHKTDSSEQEKLRLWKDEPCNFVEQIKLHLNNPRYSFHHKMEKVYPYHGKQYICKFDSE